ncbi:MAG: hypothetical protein E6I66_07615 [Chloroflexi bacterium]|nr:MAG: hypothetical protein E6I66_07615 [Chloroflexota bacterium]
MVEGRANVVEDVGDPSVPVLRERHDPIDVVREPLTLVLDFVAEENRLPSIGFAQRFELSAKTLEILCRTVDDPLRADGEGGIHGT